MRLLARILLIILSVATGALFIYSAYTKVRPIQSFEYTLVDNARLPWLLAAVAARFFIGLEAGLGLLIALQLLGARKWVLKLAIAVLIVFSGYLIFLWIRVGNNVNCGCFGEAIWMNASTSLIKNAVLLIILAVLNRYHHGWPYRRLNIAPPLLLIGMIIVAYVIYPVPPAGADWLGKKKYQLNLTYLYAPGKADKPTMDLAHGKHILAFFSASCPHCRMAAYKMHLMKEEDTTLPIFMIIGGTSSLTDFWKASNAHNIPYCRLAVEPFLKYTGGVFPTILWLDNDTVVAKSDYITLSQAEMEQWIK
jgi:hypothetical protein